MSLSILITRQTRSRIDELKGQVDARTETPQAASDAHTIDAHTSDAHTPVHTHGGMSSDADEQTLMEAPTVVTHIKSTTQSDMSDLADSDTTAALLTALREAKEVRV